MSTLHEIGSAVRTRRTEMGLTQDALARISGLSRSTVNAVEKQSIGNLSIEKAERLLESIGLSMHVTPASRTRGSSKAPPARTAIERAALSASVSFASGMTANALEAALLTGEAPKAIRPHLLVLLDEAPMSLLAKVADELHLKTGVETGQIWRCMRHLAQDLECFRAVWR